MFNIRFVGENLLPVRKEFGTKLVSTIIDSDYKITIKDAQGASERLSKGDKEAILYNTPLNPDHLFS